MTPERNTMGNSNDGPRPSTPGASLSPASFVLFVLEVSAAVACVWDQCLAKYFGPGKKAALLFALLGVLAAAAAAFAALKILERYSSALASRTGESRRRMATAVVWTLTPLLFFCLGFLQHAVFLKDIGPAVVLTGLAGCVILHGIFLSRIRRQFPGKILSAGPGAAFLPRPFGEKRLPLLVLFLFFGLYALLASGAVFPPQPFTGDEPHYLIQAKSLLADGDLNLYNNYKNRDYLQFYPGQLRPHTRTGKKGAEYQYSTHAPGLSLILLPFCYAAEKAAAVKSLAPDPESGRNVFGFVARLPLCFLAALLGFLVYRLAMDLTGSPPASWAVWLIFGLTPPLLFYTSLLYPEIPAGVILIWTLGAMVINRNPGDGRCLAAGLGVAFLPWLGMKYAGLVAAISLLVVFSLARTRRTKAKKYLLFIVPLFVSAGLYLFYLWLQYGYISPFTMYEGLEYKNQFAQRYLHPNAAELLRIGLSYFFDQRIGILAYSPVYLLFFPAIFLALRKQRRPALILLALFCLWAAIGIAFRYRGGFCPPGRSLLPLLWIMAVFLAFPLAAGRAGPSQEGKPLEFSGVKKAVVGTLLALSLAIGVLTLSRPQVLYHENLVDRSDPRGTDSKFLADLTNAFVDLREIVPSLSGRPPGRWVALAAWSLAGLLVVFLFLNKKTAAGRPVSYRRVGWPMAAVWGLSALIIFYVFFNIQLNAPARLGQGNVGVFFQDGNHFGPELDGYWTAGRSPAGLLIQSPQKAKSISVTIYSPAVGKTAVQVGRSRVGIVRNKAYGLEQTLRFPSPVGFPWKGGRLYFVQVQERNSFVPYQLDRRVQDNRSLGVFVKIRVD